MKTNSQDATLPEGIPLNELNSRKSSSHNVHPSEKIKLGDSSDEKVAEEKNKASFNDYFRIFKYADRLDCLLYSITLAGAIASGVALPSMTLVFGSSTSTFNNFATNQDNPNQFQSNINQLVLYFVYMFVGRFIIGYIATLCICIAAARMTNSLRIENVGTVFTVVLSVTLGATSVLLFLPQIEAITNACSAAAELFTIIDKISLVDPLSRDGKTSITCTGHIILLRIKSTNPRGRRKENRKQQIPTLELVSSSIRSHDPSCFFNFSTSHTDNP